MIFTCRGLHLQGEVALAEEVELGLCRFQDVGEVLEVEKACFPGDSYGRSVFLYYLAIERDGFILARSGGRVVGYVIASGRGGKGLIVSLAVLPDFRRRGIGTKLMNSALSQLGKRNVYLQVDVANQEAIRFYRGLGFGESGRVMKRYYPNGNDGIEMVRRAG